MRWTCGLAFCALVGCGGSGSGSGGPAPGSGGSGGTPAIDAGGSGGIATNVGGEAGMPGTGGAAGAAGAPTITPEDAAAPQPGGNTTLRTVSGMDGASVQVCLDGKMFGPELDLVFATTWTSSYLTAALGPHKVDAWPYVGQPCMSPSSTTTGFSLNAGESYTLFVRKSGFSGVRALKDDFSAPPAGQARVRVVRSAEDLSSGTVDVCAGSEIWAAGLGTSGLGSYTNVAPENVALTIREAATPGCTGAQIGSASVNVSADHTYSLFLVDDQSQASQALLVSCHDAASGQQIFNGLCGHTSVK